MSVRFYKIAWLVFLATVALTYISGNLSTVAVVFFGFVVFAMIFMGMMSVLPTSITHPDDEHEHSGFGSLISSFLKGSKQRLTATGGQWFRPRNVEVRRPKYP
jgi:hypothetical protein